MLITPSDAFMVIVRQPLTGATPLVRAALQDEQFGVITEVDFQARFREKLGLDHPPHVTLGACNPRLAAELLAANADAALALPCNIVLREDGGATVVTALRPTVALQRFGDAVRPFAVRAEEALGRVFKALGDRSSAIDQADER